MSYVSRTTSRLRPYHFTYPERELTMEEILHKFIDEGKRKHENTPTSNFEIKGVTTRGGKTTTQDIQKDDANVNNEEPSKETRDTLFESNEVLGDSQPQETNEPVIQQSITEQTPSIPFPRRLRKEIEEAQQRKFLENLKQLRINLPFIEALAQMPKYAKFLRSLLTNKARIEEAYTITMNERCSTVLLNKLPSKEKDPGSFTIPCDIVQLHINNALVDLGASISLMPYTMYKKLGLGEPKPIIMSLELADRVPIILGRPFLATARAMIDVFNKKITLRVRDDEVIFDINQSIKRKPAEDDECYGIDDLDDIIDEETQELLADDKEAGDDSDLRKPIRRIESNNTPYSVAQEIAKPDRGESERVYSASANEIDEKNPELKNLPRHLEYAYLHGNKSFPIITSSKLSEKEKVLLLQVLQKRKGAIAWKMSDIKGISCNIPYFQ
ncbi:DNA-directed DNA polymerase, partial [Tanacetum coccineum]